ncbi:MAG TPA: Hsp20/alpha crystallin family protein [Pyrinomonadaceae bacterium]|jgi:HSP20 family protein|nr:Hsp20/alpha crystallin family protein [Pyrinomonadaceae bacterium]
MNRLFEDASQRRASEVDSRDDAEGADWCPAADVYENDGEYTVAVDLPGIDRTALDISVDDDRLTIKGNRVAPVATRQRAECPSGKFLRTFSVPASVDQSDIRADYKDGVLQVRLPKRPERKAQRVEIKVS